MNFRTKIVLFFLYFCKFVEKMDSSDEISDNDDVQMIDDHSEAVTPGGDKAVAARKKQGKIKKKKNEFSECVDEFKRYFIR